MRILWAYGLRTAAKVIWGVIDAKYWIIAPRDIPELDFKAGDRLLIDLETGQITLLERFFDRAAS